jgi:hypothetical protein
MQKCRTAKRFEQKQPDTERRGGKLRWNMTVAGIDVPAFARSKFMQRSVYNTMIYRLLRILLGKSMVTPLTSNV